MSIKNEVELPEWVVNCGEDFLTIRVDDEVDEDNGLKVTIEDVCRYYAEEAPNLSSGIRTLAGHSGDWRPIDELANFCLDYFKGVNVAELRNVSRKFGLTPRF